jgi:hypothetical protein
MRPRTRFAVALALIAALIATACGAAAPTRVAPMQSPADVQFGMPEARKGPGAAAESIGDICQIDPTACPTVNMDAAARKGPPARLLDNEEAAVAQVPVGQSGGMVRTAKAPSTAHHFAPAPAPPATEPTRAGAMLIYTAFLNLAVFQVELQMDRVEAVARSSGGYLSTRDDHRITVRVPQARFEQVLRAVEKLGDVLHRNISAQDVTDEFTDLEARLKNARAVRNRLELLLAKAEVKEAIEIQKELAGVTEQIEQLEGKLKLLRDKIAFSTITVDFAARATETVRDPSILPFPWLRSVGLSTLLNVGGAP